MSKNIGSPKSDIKKFTNSKIRTFKRSLCSRLKVDPESSDLDPNLYVHSNKVKPRWTLFIRKICRWLDSCVDREWNVVYSDLTEKLKNSVDDSVAIHIKKYVLNSISEDVKVRDPFLRNSFRFYIDENNVLKKYSKKQIRQIEKDNNLKPFVNNAR